ncbi:uncharacterized protein LOC115736594 [Rhodamnia argentea]|uniref:Uncharacterized protein LOC115736594 n=1 Tax=Rhodamnia argentea TaxID=178133 RepID=A0A8B8NPY3_9MYRT|nr:uncharacterized protein LOC115736594 [Rhodamnia argentea]XP_030524224.1 uncharacterized protein LOC115736594 [Rhodamnia argentea]
MASISKLPPSSSPLFFVLLLAVSASAALSLHLRTLGVNPGGGGNGGGGRSGDDVHDLLPRYGFPKGILPDNVASYSLSDDGAIEIRLRGPCYVQFDQLVYYDRKITGKLSYGSVSSVSGIQAKKLFVWLPVTGMKSDSGSGMIEFYVGALSEKLPAEEFEAVPACRSNACDENPKAASM